jgi:tetratricopeptide (TPR) repeat protein
LYSRADAYVAMQKYDLALDDYNDIIKLSPAGYNAYNARGLAYMYMGQWDLAKFDFERAYELNVKNPMSRLMKLGFNRLFNNHRRIFVDHDIRVKLLYGEVLAMAGEVKRMRLARKWGVKSMNGVLCVMETHSARGR